VVNFDYGSVDLLQVYRNKILGSGAVPTERISILDPGKKATLLLPGSAIDPHMITAPASTKVLGRSFVTYAVVEIGTVPKVVYIGHAGKGFDPYKPNFTPTVEGTLEHRFSGSNHKFWSKLDPAKHMAIPLLTHQAEAAARGGERVMFDVVRQLGHDLAAQVREGNVPLGLQGGGAKPSRLGGKVDKLVEFFKTLDVGEAEGLKITVAGCGGK
jgi:hypothetical protein